MCNNRYEFDLQNISVVSEFKAKALSGVQNLFWLESKALALVYSSKKVLFR